MISLEELIDIAPFVCSDSAVSMSAMDSCLTVQVYLRNRCRNDVRLMNCAYEDQPISARRYSALISMPSAEFKLTCHKLIQAGAETVKIAVNKSSVEFSGRADSESYIIKYSPTNSDDAKKTVQLTVNKAVTECFSLKFLMQMTKGVSISARVTISLIEDAPIKVEYGIQGNGHLRFYLAPKINDYDFDF